MSFLFLIKRPFLHEYKQLEKEIITTSLNKQLFMLNIFPFSHVLPISVSIFPSLKVPQIHYR